RVRRRWATTTERRLGRQFLDYRATGVLAALTAMILIFMKEQPLAGLAGVLLLPAVALPVSRIGRERWIASAILVICVACARLAEATSTEDLAWLSLGLWTLLLYGSMFSAQTVDWLTGFG